MIGVLAQAAASPPRPDPAELVVFVIVGALALGSAISVVLLRNAVHAALMLVINFFTIAVLYAMLEAQFLAVVQIIVYAGAIMVLFLFVIMLLGVDRGDDRVDRVRGQKPVAVIAGLLLFGALAYSVAGPYLTSGSACPTADRQLSASARPCVGLREANGESNVQGVGSILYSRYVWPFEVTSVLLVIAALGAMVLGRKTEDPHDLVDVIRDDPDDGLGPDENEDEDEVEPEPAAVQAVPATTTPAPDQDDDGGAPAASETGAH